MQEDIENGETTFFDITSKTGFQKFIKNGDYTFFDITSDICSSAVSTETKIAKIAIAKKMVKYVFTANNNIIFF